MSRTSKLDIPCWKFEIVPASSGSPNGRSNIECPTRNVECPRPSRLDILCSIFDTVPCPSTQGLVQYRMSNKECRMSKDFEIGHSLFDIRYDLLLTLSPCHPRPADSPCP